MIDIVVIGAGMSGIACARALRAAGLPVRLIDKGRGIGGRMATRRATVAGNGITFDHGAQYLDQSQGAANIAALGHEAVAEWQLAEGTSRIVGVPTMAALPKALAQDLDVTLNTRVVTVKEGANVYEIETDAGKTTASHTIITVPAPQLTPILGETHVIVQQASRVLMRPCFTLMAAFSHDTVAPFVTKRAANSVLPWIAQNDTKPGRSRPFQTWIAQAHPDWSTTNIDVDRSEIKAQMVNLLCSELGMDPFKICHSDLHGWRYGLVEKPLGQSFLTHKMLWAGGDWCCGPKVQDAWQSGSDIAANVLHTLELSSSVRSEVATQSW